MLKLASDWLALQRGASGGVKQTARVAVNQCVYRLHEFSLLYFSTCIIVYSVAWQLRSEWPICLMLQEIEVVMSTP